VGNLSSSRVKTAGATLAAHQYGAGGLPLVLLHGVPGLGDYLAPVADLLAPQHWVVGYDQRGCGGSSRAGPFHFRDHVEDLNDLRRHLGVDRLHLFGHSWGGLLAQFYARAYPQHVASLILCCSIANTGAQVTALEQRLLAERVINRVRTPAGVVWYVLSQVPGLGDLGQRRLVQMATPYYHARPERAAPYSDAAAITKRSGDLTMASILETDSSFLQQVPLTAPVMILQGRHDVFRETHPLLLERFPHARSIWVEDASHFLWQEQPDVFSRALRSFYAGAAAAAT
jgi:proline iminopeptidase